MKEEEWANIFWCTLNTEQTFITCNDNEDQTLPYLCVYIFVTFDNLVVGEMQVEQEEHVERHQRATQNQTRSFTHSTRNQHSHLKEQVGLKREKQDWNDTMHQFLYCIFSMVQMSPNVMHYEELLIIFLKYYFLTVY